MLISRNLILQGFLKSGSKSCKPEVTFAIHPEKASISRSHLSAIEAPNMVRAFSMEAFFNIADALDVTPEELIQIAFLQDKILKRNT